jgi:hypothetical protein
MALWLVWAGVCLGQEQPASSSSKTTGASSAPNQAAVVAQTAAKVKLETSETLFTVLTAINVCGFDQELELSDPIRKQVLAEVTKASQSSAEAQAASKDMCEFYHIHLQGDSAHTLAQYVSLALYLGPAPAMALKAREAELPPDANYVVAIAPSMRKFYESAGMHAIWERHEEFYNRLTETYHEPLARMLFNTEVYLKLPSAGYLGREFTIYLEPMGDPGETNARNYGSDYYVVISPAPKSPLKLDQIRHTYLHYLLDPLALKYPNAMKRLEPVMDQVREAPMEGSFKNDASLLVTECLVRAIEIRIGNPPKTPDAERQQQVERSMREGYVLTRYFYDAMLAFEKDPASLNNAYVDLLGKIDVNKEAKQAAQIRYASSAAPDVLHTPKPPASELLNSAEKQLAAGDLQGARKLAQQSIDNKEGNPGRALFILAQAAAMSKDMNGALNYFQQALQVAQEPKVVVWSHIYLGRIYDLQENRAEALDHYRAALSAGASFPEAKAAAERGLQQPYEPPSRPQ